MKCRFSKAISASSSLEVASLASSVCLCVPLRIKVHELLLSWVFNGWLRKSIIIPSGLAVKRAWDTPSFWPPSHRWIYIWLELIGFRLGPKSVAQGFRLTHANRAACVSLCLSADWHIDWLGNSHNGLAFFPLGVAYCSDFTTSSRWRGGAWNLATREPLWARHLCVKKDAKTLEVW